MRKLGSKGWLAVVGVGLLLAMTCCEFRGNWSADLIEKALRRQPGVTFVSHSLRKEMGLELRAASFDVHVGPKVTAEKLASLTRTFSDHIHGSWVYGGLGATMTVMGTSESFPAQTGSTMYVSIAPSETPPDPPWQDWLTLSQGDYAYEVSGSASAGQNRLEVKLRSYDALATPGPGASEFATTIRRLAADFPESTAGWNVYDIDPNRAPSIRSDHGLPDPAQITLWEAVAQIAPTKGDFNESRHDRNRFSIDALPAEPVMVAQLRLIADSGLPATVYNVVTNQITVRPGGCSKDVQEPGPRTADADLQARLRSQFERC